ncbi:MAG TPA: dihydrofolate reductase [Candidatus Saccharimonadia bacterium]|nr:dihydrofolate reductase [Candidatus Saccharimonadia bacterium]
MTNELVLLAAMDRRRGIGLRGGLPWHLPDDLVRFKRVTLGRTILMGRRTAQSIGRALPQRRNLVLTRSGAAPCNGMEAVASLDAAIAAGGGDLVVIGGGEVYALALPRATRLDFTLVDADVGADTFFPPYDARDWREVSREHHPADARHAHAFDFVELVRAIGLPGEARRG